MFKKNQKKQHCLCSCCLCQVASASVSILLLLFKTVQGRRKQKEQNPAFTDDYINVEERSKVQNLNKSEHTLQIRRRGLCFELGEAAICLEALVYLAEIKVACDATLTQTGERAFYSFYSFYSV